MINVEKVEPTGIFTNYIYKAIPLAFDESMSYYECLCGLLNYLKNTVMPALNNNADAIIELQQFCVELKNYVDNYFKNLDVQEEINNKLDEMAESGELTDIIAQYLELAGVLAYDTLENLEGATNVANGSICMILGKDTYNDGKTTYYKIREIINTDVVDGDNLIEITNDPTLVGEKIPNYRLNQLESNVNTINTSLNRIINKKYIIVGDSYAEGYTPDGYVTSWSTTLKNLLGLDNTNCIITYHGGCGFTPEDNTYTDLIDELDADNNVTDVIIGGGYNDKNATKEEITAGSLLLKNAINTKFPNATIHLGFIGFTNTNERYNLNTTRTNYVYVSSIHGYNYLNNVEYSLKNTYEFFSSDNVHPNINGQNKIAEMMYEAIKTGSATATYEYRNLNLTVLSPFSELTGGFIQSLGATCVNNIVNLSMQTLGQIKSTNGVSITADGTKYAVGTITKSYITGTNYNTINIPVNCVIQDNSSGSAKYYSMNGTLHIENKKVTISLVDINDTNSNYRTMTQVKNIQVSPFSITLDSLFC